MNMQQADGDLTARSTSRATVDYATYVLRYGARQRGNILLSVFGVVLTTGALIILYCPALVVAVAVGIGLIAAGSVAFVVTLDAHGSYTRDLAVSISETYNRKTAPPPQTVRPFVASGSSGRTTNTGRLEFPPQVWQSLFDLALGNGGAVDKENVSRKAGIGRRWYHTDPNSTDGYRAFLAELRGIGFVDERNRLTDRALAWYQEQIALPLSALPLRSNAVGRRSVGQDATAALYAVGEGG